MTLEEFTAQMQITMLGLSGLTTTDDAEYVTSLYRAFEGREPNMSIDDDKNARGHAFWVKECAHGREHVRKAFAESDEFKKRIDRFFDLL